MTPYSGYGKYTTTKFGSDDFFNTPSDGQCPAVTDQNGISFQTNLKNKLGQNNVNPDGVGKMFLTFTNPDGKGTR